MPHICLTHAKWLDHVLLTEDIFVKWNENLKMRFKKKWDFKNPPNRHWCCVKAGDAYGWYWRINTLSLMCFTWINVYTMNTTCVKNEIIWFWLSITNMQHMYMQSPWARGVLYVRSKELTLLRPTMSLQISLVSFVGILKDNKNYQVYVIQLTLFKLFGQIFFRGN